MRQTLQLRLGQQLTMTPQLQQAIRLLQLSSIELQAEIQELLESNLMLERADEVQEPPERNADEPPAKTANEEADADGGSDAGEELPVESSWDEDYSSYESGGGTQRAGDDDDRDLFESQPTPGLGLQGYLTWQMELTPFGEIDRAIAATLIDAIDPSGYLGTPLEDVLRTVQSAYPDVELDEVEAVLHRIQQFDPAGVAARTPAECLTLQLRQLPPDTPWLTEARVLVAEHLDLLGGRDFNLLLRRMRLSLEELQEVVALIRTLNPHPGTQHADDAPQYVVPDVYVYRQQQRWRVELNPESAPRLRINPDYARLVRRADASDDNVCLRNHLQEARWFLKSLRNRGETLLKVATCIVEQQRAFLEHGEEHMKPLILRDVAEAVEMHESTISRVTTQKYMHTPRGIFEFKYFFSSHVGTADGGECSSVAIRAMIKKLIAGEDARKPLSDSKLAGLLEKEGIQVARRTVAKYREALGLLSSTERKRLG